MTDITPRWARALAVAAAATLLLSGCSLISNLTNTTQRDDTGTVTEGNDDADVFSIKVGDCLDEPSENSDGTVSTVPIVPCTDSHVYEAYASIIVDEGDGSYPGEDTVLGQAESDCTSAFTSFVGVDYNSSSLDFTYYYPTQDTWEGIGDREILCMVYDPAGSVTGTLQGAGR